MLHKIMGVIDLAAAGALLLYQYDVTPYRIILAFAFYLLLKAIIFFGDWISMIDGIVGIYMLFMIIVKSETVSIIFAIYLVQKAIFSIFSN